MKRNRNTQARIFLDNMFRPCRVPVEETTKEPDPKNEKDNEPSKETKP